MKGRRGTDTRRTETREGQMKGTYTREREGERDRDKKARQMRGRGTYGRQESGTDTLKEPETRGRGYKQDTGQPGAPTWQGGLVTSIEEAEKLLTWAGQRKKGGNSNVGV